MSESLRLENEKATYNLGSNNKIKLKDILKLIYQILKKKPKIEIIKNKSKGFNINIKKILSKNYTLFDTEKSIRLFAKEHL